MFFKEKIGMVGLSEHLGKKPGHCLTKVQLDDLPVRWWVYNQHQPTILRKYDWISWDMVESLDIIRVQYI